MYFQMPEQSNKNCGEQILMIRERNLFSEELDFFFNQTSYLLFNYMRELLTEVKNV